MSAGELKHCIAHNCDQILAPLGRQLFVLPLQGVTSFVALIFTHDFVAASSPIPDITVGRFSIFLVEAVT